MSIDIYARPQSIEPQTIAPPDERVARSVRITDISPKHPLPVRLYYRARQFVRGIAAHVTADEMIIAAEVLPKAALARFCQMPLDAQRHSLNVLYLLQDAGWNDPDLAAAALLHDIGKGASSEAGICINPWWRTVLVAVEALLPEQARQWRDGDPSSGWRYLLHVHAAHPQIGALWAAEDGCTPLTCWLIEHHQDERNARPADRAAELLAMLQWADSCN